MTCRFAAWTYAQFVDPLLRAHISEQCQQISSTSWKKSCCGVLWYRIVYKSIHGDRFRYQTGKLDVHCTCKVQICYNKFYWFVSITHACNLCNLHFKAHMALFNLCSKAVLYACSCMIIIFLELSGQNFLEVNVLSRYEDFRCTHSFKLKSLNLPDSIYRWLIFYLTDHIQSVRVGNHISTPLPIRSGVPQDSILGPILFLIFITNITLLNFITSHNMFLYADDMLFLHPLKSSSDIETLNLHLQDLHYWLSYQ